MLRNVKVIIKELHQAEFDLLNEMEFFYDGGGYKRKLKIKDVRVSKMYNVVGGNLKLTIILNDMFTHESYFYISTPYNSWRANRYRLDTFTKELDDFYNELKNDISKLRKVGIIK